MEEFKEENPKTDLPTEIIEQKDDRPAGITLKWVIIISVLVLILVYFIFFYDPSKPSKLINN